MYQICFSGSSKGRSVEEGKDLAGKAGAAIAKSGNSLLTGATIGLPKAAAEGYMAAGGKMSLGLSPATSKIEHVLKYRLPIKPYHSILYTGLNYVGRDALLISSADAVVSVGGRTGTLHEFIIAVETEKPIGFLQGAGGISDDFMDILHSAGRHKTADILFGDDPDDLVKRLIELLDERNKKYLNLYR